MAVLCTASPPNTLQPSYSQDPTRNPTTLPSMFRDPSRWPPADRSYTLNQKIMSTRPPRSNESKAALKHILLTPPSSTELPREDSFSSQREDSGSRDRSLFPSNGRSPSQDSDLPLFDYSSQRRPVVKPLSESQVDSGVHRVELPPIGMPESRSELNDLTIQHRVAFAARHPSIKPPSEREYHLFADFSMDMRERTNDRSPEQQNTPMTLPSISPSRSQARPSIPQYAPWYSTSPKSTPAPGEYRCRSTEMFPTSHASSPRKRRISPMTYSQAGDRAATMPASAGPPKRRRSTEPSKKRSRASTGSLSKEAKHNRNRSTKQRYSTNYRDYPDHSPPAHSMINPMTAAEQVAEHKVNNRKDLRNDEHRSELHPAEVVVATRLNIGCGDYLLTKRQVLNEFVEYLRGDRKKAWNKTRAQSSSNLDVGKTSQIWTFFKDVGWFDENLYERAVQGTM